MKKLKKYIYPPIFSIGFLSFWIAVAIITNSLVSNKTYAGAALAVLILLAWLIIALPIYCIRYSKIILDEKFKILFAVYNSFLIIVAHIFPFNLQGEATIVIAFIIWVLFWNTIPLICRLNARKNEEESELKIQSEKSL